VFRYLHPYREHTPLPRIITTPASFVIFVVYHRAHQSLAPCPWRSPAPITAPPFIIPSRTLIRSLAPPPKPQQITAPREMRRLPESRTLICSLAPPPQTTADYSATGNANDCLSPARPASPNRSRLQRHGTCERLPKSRTLIRPHAPPPRTAADYSATGNANDCLTLAYTRRGHGMPHNPGSRIHSR
jgi:hypothetical protein